MTLYQAHCETVPADGRLSVNMWHEILGADGLNGSVFDRLGAFEQVSRS
jgi:hypothetical protein